MALGVLGLALGALGGLALSVHPTPACPPAEEVDVMLQRCEGGVDAALQYAKTISKYMKDLMGYLEKRTTLGERGDSRWGPSGAGLSRGDRLRSLLGEADTVRGSGNLTPPVPD